MTARTLPAHHHLIPEDARQVFEGQIFSVFQWEQRLYDGSMATFEMLRRPDTVVIVAIDDDDSVVVEDEEQPGGIVRHDHLPVGRVDESDASVLVAAQRELREETGLEFKHWRLLQVRQPEAKIEWFIHVFVACDRIGMGEQRLDPGERITVGRARYEAVRHHEKWRISKLKELKTVGDLRDYARAGVRDQ